MSETHASKLLKDIKLLTSAHDRLLAAKQKLRQEYPAQHEQVSECPAFAAWLYFRGHQTEEQVYKFVKEAWDSFEGDKSQLWVWQTPDQTEPLSEVDCLMDRVDMCMGLIAQKTLTKKPVESVRDHGWNPIQHLRRILAFAQAASEVDQ